MREQREHTFRLRADDQAAHSSRTTNSSDSSATTMPAGEQLHRHDREAGHQVEVQPHQPEQRVLGLPGTALLVRHLDLDRMAREGVGQRRHEGVYSEQWLTASTTLRR